MSGNEKALARQVIYLQQELDDMRARMEELRKLVGFLLDGQPAENRDRQESLA